MIGRLFKTASGFYSYEISEAEQDYIYVLADILVEQFGGSMVTPPIVGLDSIFWTFSNEKAKLTVGWDIWSGAFIMSHCSIGDEFITRVMKHYDNG